jgi:hypothetical protein
MANLSSLKILQRDIDAADEDRQISVAGKSRSGFSTGFKAQLNLYDQFLRYRRFYTR